MPAKGTSDSYKWVALANTTAAVFMAQLGGSIVLIALPAIFRGIDLDPLAPGNVVYLLWMIMGYRLVQAVLVVTVGRFGDMFGRLHRARDETSVTQSGHMPIQVVHGEVQKRRGGPGASAAFRGRAGPRSRPASGLSAPWAS